MRERGLRAFRISGRNKWHLLAVTEAHGDLGSLENLMLLSASFRHKHALDPSRVCGDLSEQQHNLE